MKQNAFTGSFISCTCLHRALISIAVLFSISHSLTGDFKTLNSPINIREMASYNNRIYCATSGGLQIINIQTGSISEVGGSDPEINGSGFSTVTVDQADGTVYAGLDNGTLCVITTSGQTRKYTDFKNTTIRFKRLFVKNGILVIGTNRGLGFFVENEFPPGYPFIEKFGDATNPYILLGNEIRDIALKNDTLCILTPYFWAKTKLVWQKPFLVSNPDLWAASASRWTTNGATGEFAYIPQGATAVQGFSRLIYGTGILRGLTEPAAAEEKPASAIFSAFKDSNRVKVICHYSGTRTGITSGDTLTFTTALPTSSVLLSLCVDNGGRYYVGTSEHGVYRLNDSKSYWNGEVQPFLAAFNIKADHKGNLYATNVKDPSLAWDNGQSSLGIIRWSPDNGWRQLHYAFTPYLAPGINDILVDPYGRLLASDAEIWDRNGNSLILRQVFDPFGNPISLIETIVGFDNPWQSDSTANRAINYKQQNGCFNASTHMGALHYDRNNNIYFAVAHDANNFRLDIFKDRSYVGQNNGMNIFDYDCNSGKGIALATSLYSSHYPDASFDRMKKITTDRSGNIWLVNGATPPSKLTVIGKNLLTSDSNTPRYYNINPANASHGLMVKHGWKYATTGIPESKRGLEAFLADKTINTIESDIYGDVWVATSAGLFYYSEGIDSSMYGNMAGNWRFFLPGSNINCVDFDTLNNVWIGTDSGLCMLDFSTARYPTEDRPYGIGDRKNITMLTYSTTEGLLNNKIISLSVNRKNGNIFVGTSEGIQMFESGSFYPDIDKAPYVPSGLVSRNSSIQITAPTPGSTLSIFTLSGKRVTTVKLPPYQSTYTWNCRTPGTGRLVAPGVYIYKLVSPTNSVTSGKFALSR